MTPVVKGVLTDLGFDNAVKAQQMFGGHGYIEEWGMSQFVRDARIAMIYEGANGIQAMDLVGRKLGKDGGRAVMAFFNEVGAFCQENAGDEALKPMSRRCSRPRRICSRPPCGSCRTPWRSPTTRAPAPTTTCTSSASSPWATCGRRWRRRRKTKKAQGNGVADKMDAKLLTGRFFMERMLPETGTRLARIRRAPTTVMALPAEMF